MLYRKLGPVWWRVFPGQQFEVPIEVNFINVFTVFKVLTKAMLKFTISLQNWFITLSLKILKTTIALSLKATYPPTAFPNSTFFVTGCCVDYLIPHSRLNLYSFLIRFSFLFYTVLKIVACLKKVCKSYLVPNSFSSFISEKTKQKFLNISERVYFEILLSLQGYNIDCNIVSKTNGKVSGHHWTLSLWNSYLIWPTRRA